MSKIVGLRDNIVPTDAQASAVVVEHLEELLERAKAGEITAVAYCCKLANGDMSTGWEGGNVNLNWLLGATLLLQKRMLEDV